MSKSKKGERTAAKGKKKVTFRWWGDWTFVWILGGFGLTYLIFVPLKFHPLHWLFGLLGGVAGYSIGLFVDNTTVIRFIQHYSRRMILKRDRENKQKGRRDR